MHPRFEPSILLVCTMKFYLPQKSLSPSYDKGEMAFINGLKRRDSARVSSDFGSS